MKKAAATRLQILQKSFELIYAKGYQHASLDDILATTNVTKGAFYYHFKSKDEMGLAIIHELMKPALMKSFILPLEQALDPLEAIYTMMHHLLLEDEFLTVEHGCPAANLTQEMTPWNIEFTEALNEITQEWMRIMIQCIETGKTNKKIQSTANAKQITLFVMSGYWGIRNFGKLENNHSVYLPFLKELKSYLNTFKHLI